MNDQEAMLALFIAALFYGLLGVAVAIWRAYRGRFIAMIQAERNETEHLNDSENES